MRCESCGAELPQGHSTCEYCGSTWDQVLPSATASCVREGVFARIKRSPEWEERNSAYRQGRLPQMPMAATVLPIIVLAVFIAVSGFMALTTFGVAGVFGAVGFSHFGGLGGGIAVVPALMALAPVGFVVLGVFMLGKHQKTMRNFQSSPTRASAAVIVGKRTQVYGGGNNTSASTRYFLSAEFENGRRDEFSVISPDLYGKVTEGDSGVLFVRGNFALDFDRVAF